MQLIVQVQWSNIPWLWAACMLGHLVTGLACMPGYLVTGLACMPGHLVTGQVCMPGCLVTPVALIPGHVIPILAHQWGVGKLYTLVNSTVYEF